MSVFRFGRKLGVLGARGALQKSVGCFRLNVHQRMFSSTISAEEFKRFTISQVERVSHDSAIYTIDARVEMPVSSLVMVQDSSAGHLGNAMRPYTPLSASTKQQDTVRLLVKTYENGIMSKHFSTLQSGDSIELKGPFLKKEYIRNEHKTIYFVCGGSGITPCLQVINTVLADEKDHTELILLFSNQQEEDILLKQQLDALAAQHVNFTVHYALTRTQPDNWSGITGRLDLSVLTSLVGRPLNSFVYVCGPPSFYDSICGDKNADKSQGECTGILKELGHTPETIYKF